jgi:hypothetical protein
MGSSLFFDPWAALRGETGNAPAATPATLATPGAGGGGGVAKVASVAAAHISKPHNAAPALPRQFQPKPFPPWRAKPEPEPAGEVDHGPIAQVLAFARRRALPSMAEPTELCQGCGNGRFWRLSVLSGGPSAWRCEGCDPPSPDAWIDATALPTR